MRKRKIKVSQIINTEPDSGNGKGMLGFVVTYSDGSMLNKVLDYAKENYEDVLKEINAMHAKMVSRNSDKRKC